MAADCTQGAVLDFLKDRGGKVRHSELVEQFKGVFPEEPQERAAVRNRFKSYVDNVAFVKSESGVKHVCLRRKFRESVGGQRSSGTGAGHPGPAQDTPRTRYPAAPERTPGAQADDVTELPAQPRAAGSPGSGYGSHSQVIAPSTTASRDKAGVQSGRHGFVCLVEEVDGRSGEMGNRGSVRGERRESQKERAGKAPDIPEIAVIEASPLPAEGSMFTLPGPVQTGITGQVDTSAVGLSPRDRQVETECLSPGGLGDAEQVKVVTRCGQQQSEEAEDDGRLDCHSLSGSEGTSSPKGSRKHFIELMMNSSPQVRRSMVLRGSVCLSHRSDSDSVSLVSSNLDDDRASVTLDPLEHEWMMCASDGEWGSLFRLLTTDPSLVLRKDFVTGFTCLHWAAKHGKPELLALIINFAKQHNVPISVDARSNTGYTPLHIAAMHNHMDVVKLLVGAYNADVEVRDYSGRKACQYLTDNVSVDIRDIIGAYEQSDPENTGPRDGGRWRLSRVLQSNLKPLRLLNPNDGDSVDGERRPRVKPVRRKSSFSRMKPKLERLRWRTSQIVHSTSFRDPEELGEARPKTHFFGRH